MIQSKRKWDGITIMVSLVSSTYKRKSLIQTDKRFLQQVAIKQSVQSCKYSEDELFYTSFANSRHQVLQIQLYIEKNSRPWKDMKNPLILHFLRCRIFESFL